jgi:hypothetical protein
MGLTTDRFSLAVLALAVRMATKISFSETHAALGWFMPTPPATQAIEDTTLGMARYTAGLIGHRVNASP